MIRCYITSRTLLPGGVLELLEAIRRNDAARVDYIQIREKDLSARDLLRLAADAVKMCRHAQVLVNGRADIALAARAAGVHLPSRDIAPERLRTIAPPGFVIGVSCHTIGDVERAQAADFLVFGPVFDTPGKGAAQGLSALAHAAAVSAVPVLALGGVTHANAQACIDAGAAGIAAIRHFQDNLETNLRPL